LLSFSAKEIIADINSCKDLRVLNLQGNTLGVEAAKAIAKALEKHPEFQVNYITGCTDVL
jgi:Ran GTPase-activating protein 1